VKVALLTREYPPEIYGGAGVHVEYLARELSRQVQLGVYCFGADRQASEVLGSYKSWSALDGAAPELAALRTLSIDLAMAKDVAGAELVHTHTWYANFAGHLAKLMYGIPRTAWSRCGRGRRSSWAAATPSPASASARPSRPPTPSSPCPAA
jgi:starch synthase